MTYCQSGEATATIPTPIDTNVVNRHLAKMQEPVPQLGLSITRQCQAPVARRLLATQQQFNIVYFAPLLILQGVLIVI